MEVDKNREWLLKEKYHGEKAPGFFVDCERLTAGEPLAYVIGWQQFLDVKIWLDSQPLIPRTETEYWVGKAIEGRSKDKPIHVLDLCAGSGAVGVAVANALPLARVDFAEKDPRHHATITRNICDNGIDYTQTRIFDGDLFAEIPKGTRYNFIFSNPPYIDPKIDRAEPSVKNFEPHLALYGGQNGMEIIVRIIENAPDYLLPHGQLWIEHEPEHTEAIAIRVKKLYGGRASLGTNQDQYGVERVSVITLLS
ncbi:MAG: hypothetical protein RLZZ234_624 [Candidatus Parcubacteria bacterium]